MKAYRMNSRYARLNDISERGITGRYEIIRMEMKDAPLAILLPLFGSRQYGIDRSKVYAIINGMIRKT